MKNVHLFGVHSTLVVHEPLSGPHDLIQILFEGSAFANADFPEVCEQRLATFQERRIGLVP